MTRTATNFASTERPAVAVLPAAAGAGQRRRGQPPHRQQPPAALGDGVGRGAADRRSAALAALDMTQRRIRAIAGVHRQLYRAGAASTVDLGAYLEELGGDLAGYADTRGGPPRAGARRAGSGRP
ncbi:MAG: histidine kinase dimerization/phosphoacceptor domain -containing protein [Sphingomonas sp.]